jgi:hypothetical protein
MFGASGDSLETRKTSRAFNKLWNNKFYYKLHLVGISIESYYDARIHEYQTCQLLVIQSYDSAVGIGTPYSL